MSESKTQLAKRSVLLAIFAVAMASIIEVPKELQMEYFKSDGGKTFFDGKCGFGYYKWISEKMVGMLNY